MTAQADHGDAPTPAPQFFRYQRSIVPDTPGPNCAVLDAATFAHAAASLKDLRLYPQTPAPHEIPYAITLSEPEQQDTEPARILNLGLSGKPSQHGTTITFDLAMPSRPYTAVTLDIDARDFIATAAVIGTQTPGATGTRLGEFTLFDLTSQRLSRSTTLPLEESTFPYLHIELAISPATHTTNRFTQQIIHAATVPPSREAQSLFTLAEETTAITQQGSKTVASFTLPQHVPVERVAFTLPPAFHNNFSRDATITAHPTETDPNNTTAEASTDPGTEAITGTILHVQTTLAGREIRQQQLSIPATIGSNLQGPARVEVSIDNGDDRPLPIASVRLQMRERRLCFDAASTAPLTLFYGDPALLAPRYDYARTLSLTPHTATARTGPEQPNPVFTPRPDTRAATERHPELLWIALIAVVCILALTAFRTTRHIPR